MKHTARVFRALKSLGPTSTPDLTAHLGMDRARVHEALRALLRVGHVAKSPGRRVGAKRSRNHMVWEAVTA